jgi:hypothetical protein
LIINVPGSPKAVRESFAVIAHVLKHAIALLAALPAAICTECLPGIASKIFPSAVAAMVLDFASVALEVNGIFSYARCVS